MARISYRWRMTAEGALSPVANLREFRTLARLLQCGIALIDSAGHLRFASVNACELLGSESERALRRNWKGVYPQLHLPGLDTLTAGAGPLRTRTEYVGAQGTRKLRVEVHAINHRDGAHYLLLMKERDHIDASDLAVLLASQARTQAYVLASLAHEMNGPLNNLGLTLALLDAAIARLPSGALDPDAATRLQRYLDVLKNENGKLTHIGRELSALAAPISGNAGRVDVAALWREVHRVLRHEATTREIGLRLDMPEQPLWVLGDAALIRLAALNFLTCVIEVTAPGGSVAVSIARQGDDASATVRIEAAGARLPAAVMQEFYRLLLVPESDFIGLIAGRVIIEAQGGEVSLCASPDGPLGVEFRLPLAE